MENPNIIFIVWDACRYDRVNELGETFSSLADDNLSFSNAVTPAHWSLPSHVSLLTGERPSEHGICTKHGKDVQELSMVSDLSSMGYRNYGVSANHFASSSYNFDNDFDSYEFTLGRQSENGASIPDLVEEAKDKGNEGVKNTDTY